MLEREDAYTNTSRFGLRAEMEAMEEEIYTKAERNGTTPAQKIHAKGYIISSYSCYEE